ncbi:ABC transporter permease [Acetobacterium sp.]|uniref:ABC transporter permease n=1 Tax=Acetobacterium sp. TaxID=1872094 RepID=UPI003593B37D
MSLSTGKKLLALVTAVILLLVTVAPVVALSWGFIEAVLFHSEPLRFAVNVKLLCQSVGMTLMTALICTASGFLVALAVWMTRPADAGKIGLVSFALMLLPAFIHVQAWIFFMDRLANSINGLLGTSLNFSSYFAVVLTQTFAGLPLPAGLILLALAGIPIEIQNMVKLDRPDTTAFFKIYFPYLIPAIGLSIILIFLLNINDYGIASVFGVNSYALDLFAQFSSGMSVFGVFFNGLPLMLLSIGALALLGRTVLNMDFSLGGTTPENPFVQSLMLWALAVPGLIIAGLFIVIPGINLILETIGSRDISGVLGAAMPEILYGMAVSGLAAVISLIPAILFAALFYKSFQDKLVRGPLILALAAIPFLIPGPVLGLALIRVWNTGLLGGIYRSPLMPVIGLVAKYAFIEALLLAIALAALDPNFLDNIQVHWPGLKSAVGCLLHLIGRQCAAAMLIVFVLSMGEFGVSLLIMPPGYQTLTIKIYNYLHYGASDVVAVLCLFMVLLMGLVTMALFWLLSGGKNEKNDN